MAAKVRIQVLRGEHPRRRWQACGSLTFTLAQGKRMIASDLYGAGATRLVEVGTGNVVYTKPTAEADAKTAALIEEHGNWGVSFAPGGSKRHLVNRRTGDTVCGKQPVSIFGVDCVSQRQVTCLRCLKLGFRSVNAVARYSQIPDVPVNQLA